MPTDGTDVKVGRLKFSSGLYYCLLLPSEDILHGEFQQYSLLTFAVGLCVLVRLSKASTKQRF